MQRLLHRLAHRLGVNLGRSMVVERGGRYFSAFRCDCGAVQDVREMSYLETLRWARDYRDRWELCPARAERR